MKDFIEPSLGGGFRDYLPKDMMRRQNMLDTIRAVFERFGFVPLDTPAIEKEEILTGGDEDFKMQIFSVDNQHSGDDAFALRFDLTVPLARVVAMNRDIGRPFKRYQMGKVWRAEKPQAGRFREFMQCDADIVGAVSLVSDAEIIALMYTTMTELGFSRFCIKVNSRKILNGLAVYAGFDEARTPDVLRALDKLDKIGWDGVEKELKDKVGLEEKSCAKLKTFVELTGESHSEALDKAETLMKDADVAREGIQDVRTIATYLASFGVLESTWKIDFSIARGLGYYTGVVFETILTDMPTIGSVFSGGRYDNLVSRFGLHAVPAIGTSIGVDRLFVAMEELGLLQPEASATKVLVLNFDETVEGVVIETVSQLRGEGINSEIYIGRENTLKEQLGYALKQEIPVVVIIGKNEADRGVTQIKHLPTREQIEVPLGDVVSQVKKMVGL